MLPITFGERDFEIVSLGEGLAVQNQKSFERFLRRLLRVKGGDNTQGFHAAHPYPRRPQVALRPPQPVAGLCRTSGHIKQAAFPFNGHR